MIDAGIIQKPMFGDVTPPGWAMLVPAFGPMRVVVDAFVRNSVALGLRPLACGLWIRALAVGVAVVFAAIQYVALVARRAVS